MLKLCCPLLHSAISFMLLCNVMTSSSLWDRNTMKLDFYKHWSLESNDPLFFTKYPTLRYLHYSDVKLTKTKGVLTKLQWKDDAETSRTLNKWEQNIFLWVEESLHYEGMPEVKRMFVCGEASPDTCPGPLSRTDVSSQEYQAFTKHRDRLKLYEGVRNVSPTPGPKRCEFSVSRTLKNGPGAYNSLSCRPQSREWVDVAQLWGWRVWHLGYCSRRIPFSCFLSFLPQGHAPHLVNFPFCLRGLQCI